MKYSNRQYRPERIGKNECKAGYGCFGCYATGYGRLYVGKDNPRTEPDPYSFLTAKGEIDDKSKGFEAGADDYMVKPFIAQEFVWRITAILRRTYKESEESSFLLDACKVDLEQAEVYREGQEPVSLTAKEVEILKNCMQMRAAL